MQSSRIAAREGDGGLETDGHDNSITNPVQRAKSGKISKVKHLSIGTSRPSLKVPLSLI